MLSFKQYVPYRINWELLDTINLEPVPHAGDDVEAVNKAPMSVMEVLRKVIANNYEFTIGEFFGLLDRQVCIGAERYSFDRGNGDGPYILNIMLSMMKEPGGWDNVLQGNWYYFEKNRLSEDVHDYYRFFLCMGDQIITPAVTISDGPPFSFPETFLVENTEVYLRNDHMDRRAHTRLCYEKWQRETLPGRIYAMKLIIEQEDELKMSVPSANKDTITFGILAALLIAVGFFVPQPHSILIFLGAIWYVLFHISNRLRGLNIATTTKNLSDRIESLYRG